MNFNDLVDANKQRAHERKQRRSLIKGAVLSICLVLAAIAGYRRTTIEVHEHYR